MPPAKLLISFDSPSFNILILTFFETKLLNSEEDGFEAYSAIHNIKKNTYFMENLIKEKRVPKDACALLKPFNLLVPRIGLEPTRGLTSADFESAASTNSATPAN